MSEINKNIIFAKNLVTGYGSGSNFTLFPSFPVNINASQGELIALIGINGSGKTTLLKALSGLQPTRSGELKIFGSHPQRTARLELAKILSFGTTEPLKVAYITVYEFVSLGRFPFLNVFGKLNDLDIEIINEAISETGLNHKRNALVSHLSDGERQRAIIARTLSQNTPLILFDEPTAFLDIPNKFEILNTLKLLSEKHHKTIIFSTHDLQAALQLADRIWYISETELINKIPEQLIFDGDLLKGFNTKHVRFDEDLTNFVFSRKTIRKIGLTGYGRNYTLAFNALKRIGFEIESNKEGEFYVILDENDKAISGKFNYRSEFTNFDNLEELLLNLKKVTPK